MDILHGKGTYYIQIGVNMKQMKPSAVDGITKVFPDICPSSGQIK